MLLTEVFIVAAIQVQQCQLSASSVNFCLNIIIFFSPQVGHLNSEVVSGITFL